ncbi:hypothetical protein C8R44DRAFT_893158 [Mycena epipterygia]|nr:hypothetical protein C8R44DRAFT_893158 [Mycena epipterygia]
MRFPFPFKGKKKPTSKPPKSQSTTPLALPDVLWTSILALKESSDAFAPLKSVVEDMSAIWDIAERAKHSKAAAEDIARRTKDIIDVIADAISDPALIPPVILRRIERFEVLLDEIKCSMERISFTGGVQLDDAYHIFLAASILRLEKTQSSTHIAIAKASAETPRLFRITSYIGPAGEATIAQAHRVASAEPAHIQSRSISPGGCITKATIAQAQHIARVPDPAPVRVLGALEAAGVPADNVDAEHSPRCQRSSWLSPDCYLV